MTRIYPTKQFRRKVVGFLPATFWAILVAALSLSSAAIIPDLGWNSFTGIDKLGHFGFYMVFGILVRHGFAKMTVPPKHPGWLTVIICTFFGVLIECLQALMRSGRQFEYPDILANILGVVIANIIFNALLKKKYYGSIRF